jgi:predicted nucleic acid-binding protein
MNGVVLDTNVVSEPRRPRPDSKVLAWLADQVPESLFLTATVVGELGVGVMTLPSGRRRSSMEAWLADLLEEHFAGRVLSYDVEAALAFASLVAAARARGRQPKLSDAQIAAVATLNNMAVATRNVRDFEPLGVAVINPWEGG